MTVGKLARLVGLSRTALLYYDSIGLLRPSGRTAAGYRCYADREVERLRRIIVYRQAGLPLADIRRLLQPAGGKGTGDILEGRLEDLNVEIRRLRLQQAIVVKLLGKRRLLRKTKVMTRERWVGLFRAAGLTEELMERWHTEFEAAAPEAHQDFLESLGIAPATIRLIRQRSRQGGRPACRPCRGRGEAGRGPSGRERERA